MADFRQGDAAVTVRGSASTIICISMRVAKLARLGCSEPFAQNLDFSLVFSIVCSSSTMPKF